MRDLLVISIISLVLLSCSEEAVQEFVPSNKDTQTEPNILEEPKEEIELKEEDPLKEDIKEEDQCTNLEFIPSTRWKVGENIFQYYSIDGISYLSYNDWEAVINETNGSLFWVWADMYEGYYQLYKVDCDCNKCYLNLSFYAQDINDTEDLGDYLVTLDMEPISGIITEPRKVLYPESVNPFWVGKYYHTNDTFQYETLNITDSKIIYSPTKDSFVALDILEDLGGGEYLVHRSSSLSYPSFDFTAGEWFSTIKFSIEESLSPCITGSGNGVNYATFSISDYWSNYRSLAIDNAVYSKQEDLYKSDYTKCKVDSIEPDTYFEGSWVSDKGIWNISFKEGVYTPYDTRKLNYIETLELDSTSYLSIFTYGKVTKPLSDPARYDSIYTYSLIFHKMDNGCIKVNHNLDTDGIFGGYTETPETEEILCKGDTGSNGEIYVDKDNNKVILEDSKIYVESDGKVSLDAVIKDVYTNKSDTSTTYYEDFIVQQSSSVEGIWGSCLDYSHVRIFHYPNGTKEDSSPYVYIMHTPKIVCFSDYDEAIEAEEAKALPYTSKLGPYYKQM